MNVEKIVCAKYPWPSGPFRAEDACYQVKSSLEPLPDAENLWRLLDLNLSLTVWEGKRP